VVKGLNRRSARRWIENEAGPLAPVLDLDAEFVRVISAFPKQVDDDSAGLTVSEVSSSG
jgi:hypothetical protein